MNIARFIVTAAVLGLFAGACVMDGTGDDIMDEELTGGDDMTGKEAMDDSSVVTPKTPGVTGVTWRLYSHITTFANGVDHVGCGGNCNAYTGDTACTTALPILCLNPNGAPNPGLATGFYNGWARGWVGLTRPIVGNAIGSLANADALCQKQLGAGFRMAEHHDGGGGWTWYAYGNILPGYPLHKRRFWVYVNDQPNAHCF